MASLCERCAQLMQDFVNFVRRVSSNIAEHIKEFFAMLKQRCSRRNMAEVLRPHYEPVIHEHEVEVAQEFLHYMESGSGRFCLDKKNLDMLTTLAYSKNADFQRIAAISFYEMSKSMSEPMPAEFLELYDPLLRSADLGVQKHITSSLVNFLLERNLDKELVVQVGLLDPILDLLESGDHFIQCNTCACVMKISETNQEAIVEAEGILPLLKLAKSHDPRIQQNAVGAILNLTQPEHLRTTLCRSGVVPVLTTLLQSMDPEIQYFSCASLSNLASTPEHCMTMLGSGNQFLTRTLASMMSSSVQKVTSQACVCLNNLAASEEVQSYLLELDVIPRLYCLFNSNSREVREASVTLLCTLVHPLTTLDPSLCKEILQHLAMLMQTERANAVVVIHTCCIVQAIARPETIKVVVRNQCFEELLLALLDSESDQESLVYLTSCLAELARYDIVREKLTRRKDKTFLKFLVALSAFSADYKELAFHAATVIKNLSPTGKIAPYFMSFIKNVEAYLMTFLGHSELQFQQLGVETVALLCEDAEFAKAMRRSPLLQLLEQVRPETEELQAMVRIAISRIGSLSLED